MLDGYDAKVAYIESLQRWHLRILQDTLKNAEKLVFILGYGSRIRYYNMLVGSLGSQAMHCIKELLLTHSPVFLEDIIMYDKSATEYVEPATGLWLAIRD
jgi:hypothetical protein